MIAKEKLVDDKMKSKELSFITEQKKYRYEA
jgi:hypothetical protein